jgi:hypothetical protein
VEGQGVVKGEMIEECGSMLTNMEFLMKHVTITKLKIKVIYIYEFMLTIFALTHMPEARDK